MNITPAFINSLKFNHYDYLLRCINLKEVYDDINITKEEVISSLQHVENNIKSLDEDNIIDDLNDEFISVGIIFIKYTNEYKNIRVSYPQEGIVAAEYDKDKKLVIIYINEEFILNFINKKYNLMSNAILSCYTHENTHTQQNQKSNYNVKGLNSDVDIHTIDGFKKYLENPIEIDAYAREIASYLYNSGYSGSKIINMLRNNDKELNKYSSYERYNRFFKDIVNSKSATKEDKLSALKVWKRFLSAIIAYLTTTMRYKFMPGKNNVFLKLDAIEEKIRNNFT